MNASSVELTTPPGREIEPAAVVLIDPRGEGPIRAERLGLEGLEACAARLAVACTLAPHRRARSPLLRRFVKNKAVLNDVHRQLVAVGDRRHLPGIDAEWLVDNFHIIADSLREVRHDLPPGYDELLPKLAVPPLAGYPRVYALALALVAHSDSELDEARIVRFVGAFQQAAPLTIGELWALPTMLRLVLLENLRRLAERMIWGWEEGRRAERWAAEVLARARARSAAEDEQAISDAAGALADQYALAPAPAEPLPDLGELSDPFVVRLMQLLRDQEGADEVFEHLEAALAALGTDPNEVLRREHHAQAANQVTVGNCVLGLRLLSAIDWNAFFEQSSRVEAILREDPSGVYPLQDFATSDRYRRIVETIARGSGADETAVARQRHRAGPPGPRTERPIHRRPRGRRAARPRRLLPGRPGPLGARCRVRLPARLAHPALGVGAGASVGDLLRRDRGGARGVDGPGRAPRAGHDGRLVVADRGGRGAACCPSPSWPSGWSTTW